MKLAISGKGGVGKTTLSALLTVALSSRGEKVVAIDADPDFNLASALGIPPNEEITPLSEMRELIAERTGVKEGYGAFFKLNPQVEDIPERFCRAIGDIRLLVLGGIRQGGEGCLCPATALLKALLVHLALGRNEHLVMDMEAGIEHLGRATAQGTDALLIVVDHTPWSLMTARRVRKLAADVGVRNVLAVANRVNRPMELESIAVALQDIPLVGHLPTDDRLAAGILTATPNGGATPRQQIADCIMAVEGILSEIKARM
ncbi:MAG: AAA family ATPase [Planctomycetes bacterium]|nr:AAA family ATPase [Planctomycetota bacterium]